MSGILVWEKLREVRVLASKYGKSLISVLFINPFTREVQEFVQFGQKDWSVVFALTSARQVLAVRQFKQGCNKIILELPAGIADFKDETPEEVMHRELFEETGYQADRMVQVGPPMWIASRSSWTRFHCFVATGCTKFSEPEHNLNEQIELVSMDLLEWLKLIEGGGIDEPSAIIATYLGLLRLGVAIGKIPDRLSV